MGDQRPNLCAELDKAKKAAQEELKLPLLSISYEAALYRLLIAIAEVKKFACRA